MKVWYKLLGGWHETFIFEIDKNTRKIYLNNGSVVSMKDLHKRWTMKNPYKG